MSHWTRFVSQKEMVEKVNKLIDQINLKIFEQKLPVYNKLTQHELCFLLRAPIYTAVNIFIERLLRVTYQQNDYPPVQFQFYYSKNNEDAISKYYHSVDLNNALLACLKEIVSRKGSFDPSGEMPRFIVPLQKVASKKHNFSFVEVLRKLRCWAVNFIVQIIRPKVLGEYSNWLRAIYPFHALYFFNYPIKNTKIDVSLRTKMKGVYEGVFLQEIDSYLLTFNHDQKMAISRLFAVFVDYILSLALVEEFSERYKHYDKLLNNWKIKEVHATTGFIWNEDLKIFAVLARRKAALLIEHEHGCRCFSVMNRAIFNEFQFLDYFIPWGKMNNNWMKGNKDDKRIAGMEILSLGSPYLSSIRKVKKRNIDAGDITVLYTASPLPAFMCDLEHALPEETYQHRLKVFNFIKSIIQIYPGIKLLYKPFPKRYVVDPIKEHFKKELENRKIKIVADSPLSLFNEVDIILWDSISTGFAESVRAEKPSLIFHPQAEYDMAQPFGREIIEKLKKCGVVFCDVASGISSIKGLLRDPDSFTARGSIAIREFQRVNACPVGKNEFLRQLRMALYYKG